MAVRASHCFLGITSWRPHMSNTWLPQPALSTRQHRLRGAASSIPWTALPAGPPGLHTPVQASRMPTSCNNARSKGEAVRRCDKKLNLRSLTLLFTVAIENSARIWASVSLQPSPRCFLTAFGSTSSAHPQEAWRAPSEVVATSHCCEGSVSPGA